MAGMALTGCNDDNTIVTVGGKVIDNEDLKNINKMTLKEKLIKFNILRTIIQIFSAILFLVVIYCIVEDPLNFFESFENVGRAQIFSIFGLVIIYNSLWIYIKNETNKNSTYNVCNNLYYIIFYWVLYDNTYRCK